MVYLRAVSAIASTDPDANYDFEVRSIVGDYAFAWGRAEDVGLPLLPANDQAAAMAIVANHVSYTNPTTQWKYYYGSIRPPAAFWHPLISNARMVRQDGSFDNISRERSIFHNVDMRDGDVLWSESNEVIVSEWSQHIDDMVTNPYTGQVYGSFVSDEALRLKDCDIGGLTVTVTANNSKHLYIEGGRYYDNATLRLDSNGIVIIDGNAIIETGSAVTSGSNNMVVKSARIEGGTLTCNAVLEIADGVYFSDTPDLQTSNAVLTFNLNYRS